MDIIDINKRLTDLETEYDALLEETLPLMQLDDKMLKDALKEQVILLLQWEMFVSKAKLLYDDSDVVSDETYSAAIQNVYKSEKYRELSVSEVKDRAKADKAYVTCRKIQNQIRALRDESKGILETVVSRKYLLNNMAEAVIASAQNTML